LVFANILNISVFDALSIGGGFVAAVRCGGLVVYKTGLNYFTHFSVDQYAC